MVQCVKGRIMRITLARYKLLLFPIGLLQTVKQPAGRCCSLQDRWEEGQKKGATYQSKIMYGKGGTEAEAGGIDELSDRWEQHWRGLSPFLAPHLSFSHLHTDQKVLARLFSNWNNGANASKLLTLKNLLRSRRF